MWGGVQQGGAVAALPKAPELSEGASLRKTGQS